MGNVAVDLGTYRAPGGTLVHCWHDPSGILIAEREGPNGPERVDPKVLTGAVKLSDEPFWPENSEARREALWVE